MMTPNIHPKKNHKNFWLDEELARKVCTPDKTNNECAAELGVSASYIGRWRRKNGCPSSYVENRKEVATRRKEKEALKALKNKESISTDGHKVLLVGNIGSPADVDGVKENGGEGGLLASNAFTGKDCMEVTVLGNEERILLVARFDNLGKGASGAAVECMNIALGKDPICGLEV
jgi:hypothetical protein